MSTPLPSLLKISNDWAKYTVERWKKNILKMRIGQSHELKNSLEFRVIMGAGGDPEKIKFAYLYYGKFRDMGVGRGQTFGNVKGNAEAYRAAGLKGRTAKKWYSKTIYAETNKLGDILANNYGLKGSTMVKESFPSKIEMQL